MAANTNAAGGIGGGIGAAAALASPLAPALRLKRRASTSGHVRFDERPRSGCVRIFDKDLPALLVNARYRRRTLSPLLRWPRLFLEVIAAVDYRGVVLESAKFTYPELTGTVVVANGTFEKTVIVRFTTDAWKTSTDVAAVWRETVAEACNLDL